MSGKAGTLVDDFRVDDTTVRWVNVNAGSSVAGQRVLLTPAGATAERRSQSYYDISDSQAFVELVSAGTDGSSWLYVQDALGHYAGLEVLAGYLICVERGAGAEDNTLTPYDPVAHRWFRFRMTSDILYWETSPDGRTWTVRRSKAPNVDIDYSHVQLALFADGASGTTQFDSFNYIIASFAEPFQGGGDHDLFSAWARETRRYRVERAYDKPKVFLYDGDWNYRGMVYGEIEGSMTLEVNESGLIKLRLPIDVHDKRRTWAGFWALDQDARGTSNIHIIVESCGARVGGRMKPKSGVKVRRSKDGDEVSMEFIEDTEELKFVHTAGNPFLPLNLIQQPKAWMLFMQADDALRLTLTCNLLRLQLTNISIANILALLNPANWTLENLLNLFGIWEQSQIVVVPKAIGTSVEPFALAVGSIRTSFFDVSAPILEDAELQMTTRRFITGDPEPFPGAGTNWRNGTLFVDFENKSGYRSGTSLGGNLLTGLTRTIGSLTADNVEDSYDLFTGQPYDTNQFRLPAWLSTPAANPYVVYADGDLTGIQESEFAISPGGACRITAGGTSMPGVNEVIKAFVEYGGDVLGDNLNIAIAAIGGIDITVGSIGGALNAFLEPIYKDSILAYNSVPLLLRAATQGWGHYLETSSTNVTQAFTAASVSDLRARRRETDPGTEFTLKIANCTPWIIGDNGFGHYWLGDRVGGTSKYLMPHVFTRRCRLLDFTWNREGLAIQGSFGDKPKEKDLFDRIAELTTKAATGLQQIGLL